MWCEGLDQEEWEELHENDEKDYLHGYCDDWVNENYQKGDICIAITEYDYEVECICLMHSCLFRNGMYLDVRGETDDFEDVLDGFDYGEHFVEEYPSLKDFNKRMKKLGVR